MAHAGRMVAQDYYCPSKYCWWLVLIIIILCYIHSQSYPVNVASSQVLWAMSLGNFWSKSVVVNVYSSYIYFFEKKYSRFYDIHMHEISYKRSHYHSLVLYRFSRHNCRQSSWRPMDDPICCSNIMMVCFNLLCKHL